MADRESGGGSDAKTDLIWFIIIMVVLGIAWFTTGGPERLGGQPARPLINPPTPLGDGASAGLERASAGATGYAGSNYYDSNNPEIPATSRSSYFGQFSIDAGSASGQFQPNQEYIVLNYHGSAPLDITGWRLTNGQDQRTYEQGGKLVPLPTASVFLPPIVKLFRTGSINQPTSNLLISPNGRVVVVTGSPPSSDDFPGGASFQVNSCSGYLGNSPDYRFLPYVGISCPATSDFPGTKQLPADCYSFIDSLGSCHTPKFERKSDGLNYVDGREDRLTSLCRDFVQRNYNYNGCVAAFASRADFYQPEWRVFLNRPWELWAKERETITLYDRNNKIVSQLKY